MRLARKAWLVVAAVLVACSAQAVILSIEVFPIPTSDGVVTRDWSNGVVITVDPAANPLAAEAGAQYWRRSVIQFPLDGILEVTSATLWVYVMDVAGSSATLNYVGDPTANGTITYYQATTITQVIGTLPGVPGWVSKDVTPQVASDLANGYDWTTFNIIPASGGMWFAASETAGTDLSPKLVIHGVLIPEPNSVALMLVGGIPLAAGVGLRRRG